MSVRRFASIALPFVVAALAALVIVRALPARAQPVLAAAHVADADSAGWQAALPAQQRAVPRGSAAA